MIIPYPGDLGIKLGGLRQITLEINALPGYGIELRNMSQEAKKVSGPKDMMRRGMMLRKRRLTVRRALAWAAVEQNAFERQRLIRV